MIIDISDVTNWMENLKNGWVNKRKEEVLTLFQETKRYYERPFKPGTTMEEIRGYWDDIDNLENISLDYDVVAIDGDTACVHWNNGYTYRGKDYRLDGMFVIRFNNNKDCIEFKQWWMEDKSI